MPYSAGDQLGPYEILAPLGAGGMGEVYKARDTRLDRTVAVKVLPEHIAAREDHRLRFEREARAVASLNHPHICTLHDIGPGYMVMELVDGETLSSRLNKSALPLDQALKYAAQIADALDRAHRAGVTHRDIKPGNIMLTRDGAKVLDFGLAKSASKKPAPTEATLTMALTGEGTVLGTPQYMAPELFEGKESDARADIWAFGAVLYEMVTGRKAFEGKSYTSLVGAILSAEPAPMAIEPFTPSWLEKLTRRCLAKDPDDRYQSMRDIVLDLRTPPIEEAAAASNRSRWPWIAAVALPALVAAWLAFTRVGEKPIATPLIRTDLALPANVSHDGTSIAVSPDEKRVVFRAQDSEGKLQLWVRPLDAAAAVPLAGTDGAADPFWSPDGKSIGFFAGGQLKRIDAAGGPVLTLANTADGTERGASWSSAGVILFDGSGRGPLKRVSASGGAVTDATKLANQEFTHRRPWFLPDGQHYLFVVGAGGAFAAPKTIHLGSLDGTGNTKLIEAADSGAIYSAGHLLYLRSEILMAQPFDLQKVALSGDAFPVVEPVPGGGPATLGGFSASATGLLVHASGSRYFSDLSWFDRRGNRTGLLGEPAAFLSVNLSLDRTRLTVSIQDQQQNLNVWLVDPARGLRTPVSTTNRANYGLLSPDGRMAFFLSAGTRAQLFRRRADGTGPEDLIYEGEFRGQSFSVSPDSRFLLFFGSKGARGVQSLPEPLAAAGQSKAYLLSHVSPRASHPQFSPDGHWLAYEADDTGRDEIYVSPFPGPGVPRQVSVSGGSFPRWRGDGRELFFLTRGGQLATAEVTPRNGSLETGEVRLLFNPHMRRVPTYTYDVSADGQRILAITQRNVTDRLTVIQNWPALLKK
ncbi:MAG: serine/threonine-protein kinase [Bryobacteraceae bacterium]|nr:serine/threonine-protein kinase [Bryobacteraceae bacterium]